MTSLNLDEQNRFLHETVSLSKAGIPLPEGLRQVAATAESSTLQKFTSHVAESLERGTPFAEAVRTSPVNVPPEFVALIECAESGGDLNGVLDFALEQGRRTKQYRSSLLTATIYPYMVVVVLIFILLFTSVIIIPRFRDIYNQLGAELPAPTQMLVDLSYLLANSVIRPASMLLAMAMLLVMVLPAFRQRLYNLLTALPGFSRLVILSDAALLMKFIESMTARRVPLPTVLRAANTAMWHKQSRSSVVRMTQAAENGLPTAAHLPGAIPATAAWLYQRAEEQGTLTETCGGIAAYCNDRFEILSRRAVGVLEPLLILIIGLAIGFMVLSLYLPLFNIPKIIGVP